MSEDLIIGPVNESLSRFKVAGWYGSMGYHIEQWAYDEGLVVTECEECERDNK